MWIILLHHGGVHASLSFLSAIAFSSDSPLSHTFSHTHIFHLTFSLLRLSNAILSTIFSVSYWIFIKNNRMKCHLCIKTNSENKNALRYFTLSLYCFVLFSLLFFGYNTFDYVPCNRQHSSSRKKKATKIYFIDTREYECCLYAKLCCDKTLWQWELIKMCKIKKQTNTKKKIRENECVRCVSVHGYKFFIREWKMYAIFVWMCVIARVC